MTQSKSNDDLKEIVFDYVDEKGGVTFVELEQVLSDYMEVEGDYQYAMEEDPNIIFWAGCSEQFVTIIQDLVSNERIFMNSTPQWVYMVDGKGLTLDLAKQPPSDGYKSERWLPVAFNTSPPEE